MPSNVRQTNRKISQRLLRLENATAKKLNTFYQKKIRPNATAFPPEVLRQKYDPEVSVIIRKAVETAYLEGTDLVAEKVEEKAPDFVPFISVNDIQVIVALAAVMLDQFWKTTGKLVQREKCVISVSWDFLKNSISLNISVVGL